MSVLPAPPPRRRALGWALSGLALVSISGGAWFALREHSANTQPSAQERIDRVLENAEDHPDWPALGRAVAETRATLEAPVARVLDLVVALRGLDRRGVPDFERAELACRAISLARCERRSLEEMGSQLRQTNLTNALEDLAWRHAGVQDVKAVLAWALTVHRAVPGAETRTLLRLAAVADTPDARAALLSRACASDAKVCATLPQELDRVAASRPGPHQPHLLAPPAASSRSVTE